MLSPATMKEEATKRPPEGWGTYRVAKIDSFVGKKNNVEYLKFTFEHANGSQFDWLLSDDSPRLTKLTFTKMCEYEGLSWPDDTAPDAVAKLIGDAITSIDLNVKWGNGDGTFVNDVAPAGQGGLADGEEQPANASSKPATTSAPAPPKRTQRF